MWRLTNGGRAPTADLEGMVGNTTGWEAVVALTQTQVISHEGTEITCNSPTLDGASHVGTAVRRKGVQT